MRQANDSDAFPSHRGAAVIPGADCEVTIASWLVSVLPGEATRVVEALANIGGVECRGEQSERLIVVTESPGRDLSPLEQKFRGLPGVRDVAFVAAFSEPLAEGEDDRGGKL